MSNYPTYKLGEIARSTKGKKPKSISKEKTDGFEIPYVDIKAFEKGIVDNYTDGENCTFCKPDDVLIVWDGARCGFVGRGVEGAIGSTLAKISSDKYTNDFLFYFLQSKYKVLNSNPRGVGIPHIEPNLLWNFEIPDVDKTTQRAIVTRIETLFAELDKAVQHLRTAQQQLKTYRQAVLNHWLNNEDGKWETVKLGEVADAIDPEPSHRTPKIQKDGIPFVSIKDCDYIMNTINLKTARLVSKDVLKEHKERYSIKEGDFIIGKIGTIGNPVNVILPQEYALSANVVLIQPTDKINAKFLYNTFRSNIVEKQLFDGKKATTQAAFGIKKVRLIEIPFPPLAEQQRIVQEIESRLSQATASETYIENALQQAEALRQSILKKAFSGELV
ncbi:MAG: restriction endonuclease subunit S [Bacteroidales bacterium]|nr:restriction endonuclease subunit S [Bacteroidales bacterium]